MVDSSAVTAGVNATAAQYNNLRQDALLAKNIIGIETDQATVTIDWSDITKGKIRDVTLGGNRTIAFSNVAVNQSLLINPIQDATGSRTITWPSGINWPGGTAPTLSTTANAIDSFLIVCTASGVYRGYFAGFGLA